jgi:release factor glutamine methyltransferase
VRFDVIACNPPYIPSDRSLDPSVIDHEPHQALFAGTDGLSIMRQMAESLAQHLTPDGQAWIECDSTHAEAAASLFVDQGFSCRIRTDQYQVQRFLVVSFT